MTKLTKPVRRETLSRVYERCQHRAVILTVEPPGLLAFRLKGCRRTYRLTIDGCYMLAVKAEVEAIRRERKKQTGKRPVTRGVV